MSPLMFLRDYARNPVNVLMLVVVPTVFVAVGAQTLSDAAKLLGGSGGIAMEHVTAGWAAGFLAAVAMYFQVSAARDADRRLVIAGLPVRRLVAARLATGLGLATLAAWAALVTLGLRFGFDDPVRVIVGTHLYAFIYLGLGAVIGALIRNPVNGMVTILFVWIIDVFFAPTFGTLDRAITRPLPTHFLSLWIVDLPSRHGGRLGDLGLALVWTVGALGLAWFTILSTSRVARRRRTRGGQFTATLKAGWRDWRRNPALWAMLIVVPAVYVYLSDLITPHRMVEIAVRENGSKLFASFDIAQLHAGTMAPMAVTSLAAVVALFLATTARTADQRLAVAGLRPSTLLAARLTMIGFAALVATAASLAVTAAVFDARQWGLYAAANALLALTYAFLGVVLAAVFGQVSGIFIAFLIPFLDIGLAQSPMLQGEPPSWARFLPGYGGSRLLIDGALTTGFDEWRSLAYGLVWLAVLAVAAMILLRQKVRSP